MEMKIKIKEVLLTTLIGKPNTEYRLKYWEKPTSGTLKEMASGER